MGESTVKMSTVPDTRNLTGKNPIRRWIWVIFYTHVYVNEEKVIPDRYNGFGYGNHESVSVYLCTRIKL
jgi:hypothetical protein